MMTDALLAARIEEIAPKLRGYSAGMARDALHADDLFQAGCIRIMRTCEPDFSNEILTNRGYSAMRNEITKEDRYTGHVDAEDALGTDANQNYDDFCPNTDSDTPEEQIIQGEKQAEIMAIIRTLSPENQKIVRLLAVGKRQADIARELGVSRAAVCVRVRQIAGIFVMAGVTPENFSA